MDIGSIKEYLGQDWTMVSGRIASALKSDIALLNSTNDSILSNSGKQLRPMLALLFARACAGGKVTDATIRYASSAELLHNATLLHDDVADDSDQRRGVPTIRSLMGPSVAVLVGDYWLVKAMELILDGDEADTAVIKIFSKTLSDLAEGEMLQLQKAQNGDTDKEAYLRIIYNKTASLFEAACVSAAVSVDAVQEYVVAAREYATALGLAFQIQDDILDVTGEEEVLGKPVKSDEKNNKTTYVTVKGLEQAQADVAKYSKEAIRLLDEIPHENEFLHELILNLFHRNA